MNALTVINIETGLHFLNSRHSDNKQALGCERSHSLRVGGSKKGEENNMKIIFKYERKSFFDCVSKIYTEDEITTGSKETATKAINQCFRNLSSNTAIQIEISNNKSMVIYMEYSDVENDIVTFKNYISSNHCDILKMSKSKAKSIIKKIIEKERK